MRLLACLFLLLFPATARAEWMRASSAHFIVYANDSERSVRRLAEQLERYDAVLASRTIVRRNPPSPSSRITVYVVSSLDEVRRLFGNGGSNVAGFHIARAGNSIAVIPREGNRILQRFDDRPLGPNGETSLPRGDDGRPPRPGRFDDPDLPLILLLHEYAHHFIRSVGGFPEPRWLSEGAAEFYSTARFESEGGVTLGDPATHRLQELSLDNDITVEELLDPAAYERRKARYKGPDSFYALSWLFYHYLAFNPARARQFQQYGQLLVQGTGSGEAGRQAFGDLGQLQRELNRYLRSSLPSVTFPASILPTGPVEVQRISPGEAAMMAVRIRVDRGVDKTQAIRLLPEARAVAARFPGDPALLTILAAAEYAAGNDMSAIAAADAALAIDPVAIDAHIQKGHALMRLAETSPDQAAAFNAARTAFQAASAIDPDNPLPLAEIYRNWLRQKEQPTSAAISGLERAVALAPFDMSLRVMLGADQLRRRQRGLARATLLPVAFDPHGGTLAQTAREQLARIDREIAASGRGRRLGANDTRTNEIPN